MLLVLLPATSWRDPVLYAAEGTGVHTGSNQTRRATTRVCTAGVPGTGSTQDPPRDPAMCRRIGIGGRVATGTRVVPVCLPGVPVPRVPLSCLPVPGCPGVPGYAKPGSREGIRAFRARMKKNQGFQCFTVVVALSVLCYAIIGWSGAYAYRLTPAGLDRVLRSSTSSTGWRVP